MMNMPKKKSLKVCPYEKCALGCSTKESHRARMAHLKGTNTGGDCVAVGLSSKIDYIVLNRLAELNKEFAERNVWITIEGDDTYELD